MRTNTTNNTKAIATTDAKVAKTTKTKKEVAKKEVKTAKVTTMSIDDVMKLYGELGIKCTNPNAKGDYRIMGGKSSLNLKKTKYVIYSTEVDADAVAKANIDGVTVEKDTNSQDKVRPHTVTVSATSDLKAVLAVYATNDLNKVQVTAPALAN